MSYVAEPYGQFVDDLITGLTGGVAREQFLFLPELSPFRLSPPGPLVPSSLRVFGQSAGRFQRFVVDRDYALGEDNTIQWMATAEGDPAPDGVWPDLGTPFFANYDHAGPTGVSPRLSDRNPGSVLRILAESFAREYGVLSRQLQTVYEAGFLDTAGGRDLEQLVALVGTRRRGRAHAGGSVVFSRHGPAPADIFIPAGTRLSSSEPPGAAFETIEARTLRRGEVSAEVPIQALSAGSASIVPPGTLSVIHRPILGIDTVTNPRATFLLGSDESDEALRRRAQRALESAGRATTGALLGSLGSLPGVRENLVRISEDHLLRPGVITLHVAAPLDAAHAQRAQELIDATRPAGIRVLTNLDAPAPPGHVVPPTNDADDAGEPEAGAAVVEGLYQPVKIRILALASTADLSASEQSSLLSATARVARDFVEAAGIGETLFYNRLVASLMAVEGIQDVAVELFFRPVAGTAPGPRRRNLIPARTLRPRLDDADLEVELAGELVAFDVWVKVILEEPDFLIGGDSGRLGDAQSQAEVARVRIMAELQDKLPAMAGPIDVAALYAQLSPTDEYTVTDLSYRVEYVQAGVVVHAESPPVRMAALERGFIRTVKLTTEMGA